MVDMENIIRALAANAEAIRALEEWLTDAQALWKPNPETWCMQQVVEHLYNEERIDFRKHLMDMLSGPPKPWDEYPPGEKAQVESCEQALEGFIAERGYSIAWLQGLEAVDWDAASENPWGRLSRGDVLVSWVAHDYLHIRQINELLFAWNEAQAAPYSVEYAGGW